MAGGDPRTKGAKRPLPDLSACIERLPFTRFRWRLPVTGGLGCFLDSLDAAAGG